MSTGKRRPEAPPTDNQRRSERYGCYCMLWDKDPGLLRDQGVPEGYCANCEICGRPGHTRHFPGASPCTGSWCDKHYSRLRTLHPQGSVGCILYLGALALLLFAVLLSIGYQILTRGI